MRRFAQTAFAAILVGSAAFALPQAASASTIYPPSDACSITPSTIEAGGTVDFSCGADTFGPDETVTVTVTGENGESASFGFVKFAVSTGSTTVSSTDSGALEAVSITLPEDASGVYNIEALSATSAGGTASTTIVAADGGLPATGSDSAQLLGLWVGGGTLLLAGAAIAVVSGVRRARRRSS